MGLTYTENWKFLTVASVGSAVTSDSLVIAAADLVVVGYVLEGDNGGLTLSVANSGSALSWTSLGVTSVNNNCKVGGFYAVSSGAENRTVTVSCNSGTALKASLGSIVLTGAHATTPVPAGNKFSGTGGTDVTQSITPTSSGSALWMFAGDWSATNSFAAAANCTMDQTRHDATAYTSALFRPTTQPRTDALAFTIGESDTSGTIAWIAFEVQAAAAASGFVPYQPWLHRGPVLAQ